MRRIFVQSVVSAIGVIMAEIPRQASEISFMENGDVVEPIVPKTSAPLSATPFCHGLR